MNSEKTSGWIIRYNPDGTAFVRYNDGAGPQQCLKGGHRSGTSRSATISAANDSSSSSTRNGSNLRVEQ